MAKMRSYVIKHRVELFYGNRCSVKKACRKLFDILGEHNHFVSTIKGIVKRFQVVE